MNLKFNGQFKAFRAIMALFSFWASNVRAQSDLKCIPDLVKGYGMDGESSPKDAKLSMCPMVKQTCCTNADQIVFYKNWIIGGESSTLRKKLDWQQEIYFNFLDELSKVYDLAQRMDLKLADKPLSNCKILTSRVLHFQIESVSKKLKGVISNFHKFLYNSFNGFYCMICDAKAHSYFNIQVKEIVYSRKFCRDLMANSFHFLLYFNLHIPRYVNLILKFLNYCDANGVFDEKEIEGLLFPETENRPLLENCRTERNGDNWFSNCEFICKNFNIAEFKPFWAPNLDQVKDLTSHFNNTRSKIEEQFTRTTPVQFVIANSNSRVLTETVPAASDGKNQTQSGKSPESLKEDKAALEKKLKDPVIFKSETIIVPLAQFKASVAEFEGIDLIEYGKKANWDDDYYLKLAELVKKKGKTAELTTEDTSIYKKGVENFGSSAGLIQWTSQAIAILALLLMNWRFNYN